MALIYDATFDTSTRLLTFLDRSGNTIYSFTVPARGIVDDPTKPLYLLSKQDNSTVTLAAVGTVTETYEYSTDEVTWTPLSFDTPITLDSGEGVYVRSVNTRTQTQSSSRYVHFVMTGEIEAYHNINSMLTPTGFNVSDLLDIQNSKYAFASLFYNQTALTKAPVLYPTNLSDYCYYKLFDGCSNVNKIQINATSFSFSNCLASWDAGVSATGDFYCYDEYMYNHGASTTSGIPYGWTVHSIVTHEDDIEKPLYFVSKQNGSTLSLSAVGSITDSYQTSSDGVNWTDYTLGSTITLNNNEGVYFSIKASLSSRSSSKYVKFSGTGMWEAYHNINSMVNPSFADLNSIDVNFGLINLFNGMSSLNRAPLLPSKAVSQHCYDAMFKDTSITTPPVLYPHTLTSYCYASMFEGSAITTVPALPVRALTSQCYRNMFRNCTSITGATLPAPSLASGCYYQMFYGCSSLNEVHISAKTSTSTTNLENWLSGVAATGNFYCYDDSTYTVDSASGIPVGWTVHPQIINDNANKPLYLLSKQDGSTITLSKRGTINDTYEKSSDGVSWSALSFETSITLNSNEGIYIRSAQSRITKQTFSKYVYFKMTGEIEAYHNINSMLTPTGFNVSDLTTISNSQYAFHKLFGYCSVLKKSPILPSTSLSDDCYNSLFAACTGLTIAPVLPATTLSFECYYEMFFGCTGLTSAPSLPATTLANDCYSNMFYGCTGLTSAPSLSATNLTQKCYENMFTNCTGLTTAPVLDATSLALGCYSGMFSGCTGLTSAPSLPATTLYDEVYSYMFYRCTGLTSAPLLPATTLTQMCYYNMFNGCSNLKEVHISATDISASSCLYNWLNSVSATGDFYCSEGVNYPLNDPSGIPSGWTKIINDNANKPLTFISEADGSTVSLKQASNDLNGYETSTDGTTWTAYTSETPITLNNGDSVAFRAAQTRSVAQTSSAYAQFSTTGTIKAYHNINSLLSPTFTSLSDLTSFGNFLFYQMFKDNANLYRAPLLPGTALGSYAYMSLFEGTSITAAPALPATIIGTYAYHSTFQSCASLTTPPVISAVDNLPANAFTDMFRNCTTLTQTPVLNAKVVPSEAYDSMFHGCSSLNAVYVYAENISEISSLDRVPTYQWLSGVAATGTFHCYTSAIFRRGINGIPTGWTIDSQTGNDDAALPLTFVSKADGSKVTFNPKSAVFQTSTDGGTTWTDHSSNTSFTITLNNGDSVAIKAKANLTGNQSSSTYRQFTITGTVEAYHNVLSIIRASDWNDYNDTLPGYAFYKLFEGCSGLTRSPMLLPTNFASYCYAYMFNGCTGLTSAPSLPSITLASLCYTYMFYGCTGLTTAPSLPATTLAQDCYCGMFKGCTGLTSAPNLPATTLTEFCYSNMFYNCRNLNEVHIYATNISASACLNNWLYGVASSGKFYRVSSVSYLSGGSSGCPVGWTKYNI